MHAHTDAMDILKMDIQERSFIGGMKRRLAAGRSVNAFIDLNVDRRGVSIRDAHHDNHTPIESAAERGWCTAIIWLLKKGADVHIRSPCSGIVPLHAAAIRAGPRLAVVLLLDAGARVEQRDRQGRTALHYAAELRNEKTCKLLLSRGASLDVSSRGGYDPEAVARRCGSATTADLLAEVRAAGGWDKFVHEPRAELLALRRELPSLRERGRASPSTVRAHERLFLNTSLPDEVFSHILAFWRTSRDY